MSRPVVSLIVGSASESDLTSEEKSMLEALGYL